MITHKKTSESSLTSGKLLGWNVFWNLGGSLAPLLAAALAVPYIIERLGTERFGLLTIIWVLIGYFSFFDMGLGQAITRRVAEGIDRDRPEDLAKTIWTALFLMLGLSIAAGILIWIMIPWLTGDLLHIPDVLQKEFEMALKVVAISMPIVVSTAGLRGVLEAYQKFRLINLIRIPMGMFIFLSPLLVLPFMTNLIPLVLLLIVGRFLAWLVYARVMFNVLPELKHNIKIDRNGVGALLSFGGWMTMSNLVLPVMVYFDRFVIGAMLSLTAITYYVTPHEIVTRLRIIPTALGGVIFPALARSFTDSSTNTEKLFRQSQTAIFLGVFPLVLFISLFSFEGLNLWLDEQFAEQSASVVKWLAAGVLVNAMGATPVNLIRAAGRPDLTAKVYLAELPVFFLLLIKLVEMYGISGAAFAYFFRWLVDTGAMLFLSARLVPETMSDCIRTVILLCSGLILLFCTLMVTGTFLKVFVLLLILAGLAITFRNTIFQWKSLLG